MVDQQSRLVDQRSNHEIRYYPQIENFFIGGNVPPTAPAPGTKRCRPCASWGPWGALTWQNAVPGDSLVPSDEYLFFGWDVPPTSLAPGTKRCRPCAFWGPYRALTANVGFVPPLARVRRLSVDLCYLTHLFEFKEAFLAMPRVKTGCSSSVAYIWVG